ncbi:MAG: hypothetical protein CVT90_01745, partial [Candidatus Altiarchaeales archaeon HGW-Altiarchaeales-3]
GFCANNLRHTLTVFHEGYHPGWEDLQDTNFKAIVDKLYKNCSIEIGPHTISGGPANRTETNIGLLNFRQYNSINWVGHGSSNRENLKVWGWDPSSDYYILDLLYDHNYSYAWNWGDYDIESIYNLNLFLNGYPDQADTRHPVLFYNNQLDTEISDNKRLYIYPAIRTDYFWREFYANSTIDKLIDERGLHIAHVYWSSTYNIPEIFYNDSGIYKINSTWESTLNHMSEKQQDMGLWCDTVSNILDHLIKVRDVTITHPDSGNKYMVRYDKKEYYDRFNYVDGFTIISEDNISSAQLSNRNYLIFVDGNELVLNRLTDGDEINITLFAASSGIYNYSLPRLTSVGPYTNIQKAEYNLTAKKITIDCCGYSSVSLTNLNNIKGTSGNYKVKYNGIHYEYGNTNDYIITNCSITNCSTWEFETYYEPLFCGDGTPYGQCSTTKPEYCNNGTLIDNCSLCGCDAGQDCNATSSMCYTSATTYCTCNNCTDCNDKLNNPACNTVNLITNINHNETCIIFPANNKIFDCGGHTIEGDSTGGDIGIHLNKKSGNTIKNCIITGFYRGVALYYSTSNLIINNTANSNSYGIYLYSSSENILSDNTGNLNKYYGIYLQSSSNNAIVNNAAVNNQGHGLYISTSDGTGNIINSNTLCNNNQYGGGYYDIYDADNNTGEDNTCDTAHNWNDTGAVGCTFSCVANTCSDGTLYGSCSTTKPEYCDNGTLIDDCNLCGCDAGQECNATSGSCYLTPMDCTCNNCMDCNDKLNNPACTVVNLTKDIYHNGTCIIFPANNKIFDCLGYTIEGNDTASTYGILLKNKTNNTVKNCVVSDFWHGIYLLNSANNNLIVNNTVDSSGNAGILLQESSSNNIVINNTGRFCGWYAIELHSSSNNKIIGNTANNNSVSGIFLYNGASNNQLINNTATGNSNYGIYLSSFSNNNVVSGNIVNSNNYGIRLYTSSENSIISNTANNNTRGISLSSSNNSNLNSNLVCNNTNSDINIVTGTGNTGDNTCNNLDNGGNSVTCTTSCSLIPTCSDGTPYGSCSATKPEYCD